MKYIEITEEAFTAIQPSGIEWNKVDNLELANKYYYQNKGCNLMIINNFIGDIWQYYIADINS